MSVLVQILLVCCVACTVLMQIAIVLDQLTEGDWAIRPLAVVIAVFAFGANLILLTLFVVWLLSLFVPPPVTAFGPALFSSLDPVMFLALAKGGLL